MGFSLADMGRVQWAFRLCVGVACVEAYFEIWHSEAWSLKQKIVYFHLSVIARYFGSESAKNDGPFLVGFLK